jgi:LacI family transcriptional regulator
MTGSQETTTSAMEIPESATLRDIARVAGVSLATVSRALNGSGGRAVSAEKRALILNAADRLHYHSANPPRRRVEGGAALAHPSATHTIGLILRATYRFTDPFWSPVLEGVTEEALRQGYHIRSSLLVGDLADERLRRQLSPRNIDGLLLIGDMGLVAEISGLASPDCIVVIAGADESRWESDVRFDVITMEKHAALDRVVGHLVGLGRRRLGFLGPSPERDRRGEAFIHALARRDLPRSPELFVECDFGTEPAYVTARRFLGAHARDLDALVCACDTIAIGAMRAAKELGIRLPVDLAITGYDNIPFSRDLDPPLTTVQVPKELMGELAARRLIERIAHPDWPPIIQVAPTKLVVRRSCGEAGGE